jgi:hypothetical protein
MQSAEMLLSADDSQAIIEARAHLQTARLLFDEALRLATHFGLSTEEKFGWNRGLLLSIIAGLERKAGI